MPTPEHLGQNGPPSPPVRGGIAARLLNLAPGDAPRVLCAGGYFFCLLFGYYLLRPIREEFGIRGDLSDLPWLWTGTSAAMLLAAPAFAWLVSRLPRRRFIPLTYRFFALNILIFYAVLLALPHESEKPVGYAFYIWLSVYNLFAVSVFWGFMADLFRPSQAARCFGAIGVGGTLGAACGGVAVEFWLKRAGLPPLHLMLLCVVMLELAVVFVRVLLRGAGLDGPAPPPARPEPGPFPLRGFVLIARSPYLMLLAVYMLCYTVSGAFIYFEQARIVKAAFEDTPSRIAYFNRLDLFTNALTLLTQLFVTGRMVSRLGVLSGLALLPLVVMAGFAALLAAPIGPWSVLVVFGVFRVLQRSAHHAIDRPTREMLYAPLGPDEKYKSKSFIDTFVYRGGDLIGAWLQAVGAVAAAAAPIAIALGAAWLGVAGTLAAMHRRLPGVGGVKAPPAPVG